MDVIREKQEEAGGRRFSIRYNDNVESQSCIEIDENNSEVMRVLNQVAFLYIEHRALFDALIRKIYLGQNQADISRERGISRQAVSKQLRQGIVNMMTRELGMKTPVAKREKLLGLTGKEFEVYKKIFVDGCTERSAAIQLGIPKSTVHDIGQNLRRKLAKNRARKKPVQKNRDFFLPGRREGDYRGSDEGEGIFSDEKTGKNSENN
jgi:predicted DNA-binding protein (UPF0251 family)|nr:MAG TPA: ECF sigma factor [Caudoviricetes sp.]